MPDKVSVQNEVCEGMSLDASWQAVEQVNSKPETFVEEGVGTGAFDIGIIMKKTANTRIIIAIIIIKQK